RHCGKRQQVTRLPVAPLRPEPAQGEIEDAAGEPVVDEPDEQPGDEEPDRDHDPGARRIVRKGPRLRADQRERDTDEEGDRGDRVLAILRGLPRVVAELGKNRSRGLREERSPRPPRAGLIRVCPISRDAHPGSVWDGRPAILTLKSIAWLPMTHMSHKAVRDDLASPPTHRPQRASAARSACKKTPVGSV